MGRSIRILLVEDSLDDVQLLLRALERYGFAPEHRRVDSLPTLTEALRDGNWDVVLIDYALPAFSGVAAISAIQASRQRPGMVIVSGTISEATAVETLSSGAHDYVLKDNLTRLGPAVDHALREARQRVRQEWAEDELRKSEEKYRQLHESMRDAFIHVGMDGRILGTNSAFHEIVGYNAEELSGTNYLDLIPEKWHALEAEVLSTQVLSRGYSDVYEKEYRRKDGSVLAVEARRALLRDGDGNPVSIWSTVRDITERRGLENRLEEEKGLLFTLINNLPDSIYFKDAERRFIIANAAHVHVLGAHAMEEIVGKTDFDFLPAEVAGQFAVDEEAVMKSGRPLVDHEQYLVREGEKRWLLTTIVPLRDTPGTLTGIVGVSRDVTDRRNMETQLQQAQKMEAVGQLAGGVAHDFNNILTAIIGFASFLQLKLKGNEPMQHNVDQIVAAAERAAELTQSLLTFSRKQIINLKPVDLNGIIGQLEKFLARVIGEDVQLKTALHATGLIVLADRGQIEQVLMNLAANSRDAMPEGGAVIITTDVIELDGSFIEAHGYGTLGRYALVSFEDTGMGMDKSVQERLFEPFFTTKEVGKGTGLGLSIAYGIVKQHGGFINVYSEPKKGTTFRIYLPLTGSPAAPPVLQPISPARTGTETILLGEDDQGVRQLTKLILEQSGYTVIEAVDGEDALEKYRLHRATVALLVLDIVMPKKSGKSVADEIRGIDPQVRAIFISGYTANIIDHAGILEKGLSFISKPFSPQALLTKVREVLDS